MNKRSKIRIGFKKEVNLNKFVSLNKAVTKKQNPKKIDKNKLIKMVKLKLYSGLILGENWINKNGEITVEIKNKSKIILYLKYGDFFTLRIKVIKKFIKNIDKNFKLKILPIKWLNRRIFCSLLIIREPTLSI